MTIRKVSIVIVMFAATIARADVIASNTEGWLVASEGRLQAFDATATNVLWSVRSVENPSKIATAGDRVAVIDAFANRIAIVRGRATRFVETGETPIAARFHGEDLIVLARHSGQVERHRADGSRQIIAVGTGAAFMKSANGFTYVYSQSDGVLHEIALDQFKLTRRATLAPFASDFEIDGTNGYLLYPREATLRAFPLASLEVKSEIGAGAVPVDFTLVGRANALSAQKLAIADPAAKRVWTTEGLQSVASAFSRGFLRGLLGLGLLSPANSEFPTGVDRVISEGGVGVAYDSVTRTLYRFRGSKSTAIAKDIGPSSFTVARGVVAVWQDGSIRLVR